MGLLMTERHIELSEWIKAVLWPSPSSAAALCMLLVVGWGLMHGVLVPEWQSIAQQARAVHKQVMQEQHISTAVAHVTVMGRLVAANETTVIQVCQDTAARHAVDVVALEWHVSSRTLSVSLKGGMIPLLAWWDDIGRLALLGDIQQWQLQPIADANASDLNASDLFQFTITAHLSAWHWEALRA